MTLLSTAFNSKLKWNNLNMIYLGGRVCCGVWGEHFLLLLDSTQSLEMHNKWNTFIVWQDCTNEQILCHEGVWAYWWHQYCKFDLNWPPLNWGSFVLGFCPCNQLCFWSYPTIHWVNCEIRSKTESIAWVEAENKAPPIWRWGDERVVIMFT